MCYLAKWERVCFGGAGPESDSETLTVMSLLVVVVVGSYCVKT